MKEKVFAVWIFSFRYQYASSSSFWTFRGWVYQVKRIFDQPIDDFGEYYFECKIFYVRFTEGIGLFLSDTL